MTEYAHRDRCRVCGFRWNASYATVTHGDGTTEVIGKWQSGPPLGQYDPDQSVPEPNCICPVCILTPTG